MAQPIDYDAIIDRLAQLTAQGKLAWSALYSAGAFVCVLEQGAFVFKINEFEYKSEDRVAFSMTDAENNEIFRIAEPTYSPLGEKLYGLHEDARRSALGVEEKLKAVNDILGKL